MRTLAALGGFGNPPQVCNLPPRETDILSPLTPAFVPVGGLMARVQA